MPKFCTRCGRPLSDGDVCRFCSGENNNKGSTDNTDYSIVLDEAFKNFVGIGNPEINRGDAYEYGKQIVPDCINATEGEIPVKQYDLAILQNRFFVIPYAKAIGKLQVTNKRVIFRAPGRSILGRSTIQYEFAIDELSGIEVRRDYYFSFWDFIASLLINNLGLACGLLILGVLFLMNFLEDGQYTSFIFSGMVAIGGFCPMIYAKKHWLVKIFCLGCSLGGCTSILTKCFGNDLFTFLVGTAILVISILILVMIIFNAVRPNLVFIIKNKSSHDTIDITRRSGTRNLLGLSVDSEDDHTGFFEVLPGDDADICIRELNAMITDIQKLGDFAINRWKA